MTKVATPPFGTTTRRALAIVVMIVALLALFYGVISSSLPGLFLPFAGLIALVTAWSVYGSEHSSLDWLRLPLAITLLIVGLLGILAGVATLVPATNLVIAAGVAGTLAACWIWTSNPLGYVDWLREATAENELLPVEDCDACDGPQKVVHMRQQVADAEDRLRETEAKLAESRKKQRAATAAANRAASAASARTEAAPKPAPKPATKATAKTLAKSKKEVFTTDAPAPKNLIKRKPAKADIDDLKTVSGVGPVFEKLLNKNGVYQFKQLAEFKKRDVEWLSAQIGSFPDRIERDEWVKQAKALARKKR